MQKELLSAYIDGEDQVDLVLDTLCKDEKLQTMWNRYHLIRSAMRNESEVLLGSEFTHKMASLIDSEAQIVSIEQPQPDEVHTSVFMQKLKQWVAPITQVAVAASVCLVAVFGVQTYLQNGEDNSYATSSPTLQTLPFTTNLQQVSYNAPNQDTPTLNQLEQQNRRINIMLQNHELQRRINSSQQINNTNN